MDRLTQRDRKHVYVTNENTCTLNGYDRDSVSHFCENVQCPSTKDRTCPYLMVIDRLADCEDAIQRLCQRYAAAKGAEKSLLGTVLGLFGEAV